MNLRVYLESYYQFSSNPCLQMYLRGVFRSYYQFSSNDWRVWPKGLGNTIEVQTLPWSLKFHCVKSVRNRSFSGPYSPAFGLNI